MATSILTATTPEELVIEIYPRNYVEYKGSIAQLRQEGLIPDELELPVRDTSYCWSAKGFDYWLRRTRPDGLKGPMKLWVEGDYWFVRRELTGETDGYLKQRIYEQSRELEATKQMQTPEYRAQCNRHWTAHNDKQFQAFIESIIGKKPSRRGTKRS